MARRRAGACQPSHRWYIVRGGIPVIVAVFPIAADHVTACHVASFLPTRTASMTHVRWGIVSRWEGCPVG